ncbi:MAG: S9 family peptidase [Chloroflexi bacterium]|nr:S9 family peptidase [Chloroflexota bacterium]
MSTNFLSMLLHLPTVTAANLSPDGRWIAFVWYRVHENLDVFVVPADGSAPPLALTHTPEATVFVSWAPDSRSVVVAEDHDRDEQARLFRVWLDHPGAMEPLTEDRPPYYLRGGSLSANGRVLFYGANYDASAREPIEPTWIYRHDLETGERAPIARPQRPTFTVPTRNAPATHLLYGRKDRHPSGYQAYLVDVEGGEDKEILNFGDQVKVFAAWLPDGENVLFISDSRDGRPQSHRSVGVYHWPSGGLRWLIDDPARNIEGARVSPDGLVVVDEVREARHHPSFIVPASGAETFFPQMRGNLMPFGRAAHGRWIAQYYSSVWPPELVSFALSARSPDDLTSLTPIRERTELRPESLASAEDLRWSSSDGLAIQGWLYRARPNPRRAVIFVHGGPTAHSEDRLNPQIQYFVSQGFNVLDVNYRGSTGFGLRFRELIKEDGWGGREQADITAGAEALLRAELADPGRVGVTGTSYGGYSAWCQITHAPRETIAAAAPICPTPQMPID